MPGHWANSVRHAESLEWEGNDKWRGRIPQPFLNDYVVTIEFPFGSPQMVQTDEGEAEEC